MSDNVQYGSQLIVFFYVLFVSLVFYVLFVSLVFYVLFVCKCVLYYCHRVSTQLQLTNISYHINAAARRCSAHAFRLATQITQLHHLPLNMTIFWGVTPCSLGNTYRRFQSTCSKFFPNAGTYQTTRSHFTEDSIVQNCRQESSKTHLWLV